MKIIIGTIFLLNFGLLVRAQDTITVFVNNIKAATAILKEGDAQPLLKIKKYKLAAVKKIRVSVTGNLARSAVYKKDLEVRDKDSSLGIIPESNLAKQNFEITPSAIKSLVAGKKLELVLLLNPANRRMMIASRMKPLCYLMMK
jgi:hypothetical protein